MMVAEPRTPTGVDAGTDADVDPTSPAAIVRAYLETMEARDLTAAKTFLADGFTMTFPGGATFTTLDELIAWATPRYRRVGKIYERFDIAPAGDGGIVYCFGALHGEWPDGAPFEGIRFIDRFRVANGKLADQMVWNDLAEVRLR